MNKGKIRYFNGTGADLVFYKESDCTYHHLEQRWILNNSTIQPYHSIPNHKYLVTIYSMTELDKESCDWVVPVIGARVCTGIEPLPPGFDCYIVTKAFKAGMRDLGFPTNSLAIVGNKVYNKEGKHLGYLNLCVY